ncbi:hypothetical protein [Ruania halotolerans]|uniref:hypothetical protein n=1 Tax=Ruania halotolerans TaxID=2897773 RepID=UPI001E34DA63|nr:hypothetical protein [Ruania halotolerans]UFU06811.1 hypothetical protein LQF10_01475 [Ruania halotolerans]
MDHQLADAPAARTLRQTGPDQQRSLSVPNSRIVLNPQNFFAEASEVEQNCAPSLPLGLGYYAHDQALFLSRFLTLWAVPRAPTSPAPACERLDAAHWSAGPDIRLHADGTVLEAAIAAERTHSGSIRRRIRVDPARPILRVGIGSVHGQWALRLRNDAGRTIHVQDGAATVGLHRYDLAALLGETDGCDAELILELLSAGASVRVEEMTLVPERHESTAGARQFSTDWSPGGLGFAAVYPGGGALHGNDVFAGEHSVLREVTLDHPLGESATLVVAGEYVGGVELDHAAGVVRLRAPHAHLAITVPNGSQIRYYADETELQAGGPGLAEPRTRTGLWAVTIAPDLQSFRLGCGFSPTDPDEAVQAATTAATYSADERAEHWHSFWDGVLARVPHPHSFSLLGVPDDEGVGPQDVRAAYYRAFLGLYANVLPAQPESGYHHPTVATGKGSMWNYGAPGARTAAAWETFLAIQFLAYLDPEVAWASFHGLMTLVVEDGSLAGEGLPSRKAQTAWILFSLTGDREALAAHYPALRRLLHWQAKHPRWVYGDYDYLGEQDAEFMTSAVIDLGFAQQIAAVLEDDADMARYEERRTALLADYAAHCFRGEERAAVQHWFPDDPTCGPRGGCEGLGLQVAMGLAIDGLPDWQRASLLARFDAQFDPHDQLGGFDVVKHSNLGYTVDGLMLSGRWEQAQTLANIALRDVLRSGSFAEVYDRGVHGPRPGGVRPSIFGMTQVIDTVWLNNGFRMDGGAPQVVGFPDVRGGLDGVRGGSRTWQVEVDVPRGGACLTDATTGQRQEVALPTGSSVPITASSHHDAAIPAPRTPTPAAHE